MTSLFKEAEDTRRAVCAAITTTNWEFKIIPMDSVERIFEVASEKQIEIDRVQTGR